MPIQQPTRIYYKNNMKIIIITKSDLRFIPPVISVAYILKGLGHDVHIITSGASDSILKEMNRKDITIDIYPYTTATCNSDNQ